MRRRHSFSSRFFDPVLSSSHWTLVSHQNEKPLITCSCRASGFRRKSVCHSVGSIHGAFNVVGVVRVSMPQVVLRSKPVQEVDLSFGRVILRWRHEFSILTTQSNIHDVLDLWTQTTTQKQEQDRMDLIRRSESVANSTDLVRNKRWTERGNDSEELTGLADQTSGSTTETRPSDPQILY